MVGLGFLLGALQALERRRQESWPRAPAALTYELESATGGGIILGLIGIALLVGGVWGWVWMRRRASPDALLPPDTTLLLDGSRTADTSELATSMLMAALLANEHAGAVTFEAGDDGLIAVPTGVDPGWPAASIEHRLLRETPVRVSDVVSDWLGSDSYDPWLRVVNIAKVSAVVRGFAEEHWSVASQSTRLTSDARDSYASLEPAVAAALLEDCRTNWPEWWQGLRNEITSALNARVRGRVVKLNESGVPEQDDFSEPSPWELEAATDRPAAAAQQGAGAAPKDVPTWGLYLLLVIFGGGFLYFFAWPSEARVPVLVVWGILTLASTFKWRGSVNQPLVRRFALAANGAMVVAVFTRFAWTNAWMRLFLVLAVVVIVWVVLRTRATRRIQAIVDREAPAPTPDVPSSPPEVSGAGRTIPLEIVRARDLAKKFESRLAEFDVHEQRMKELRRVRWIALLTLIGGFAVITATFWYPGPTFVDQSNTFARRVPMGFIIVAIMTLFVGSGYFLWTRKSDSVVGSALGAFEASETHPWSLILLTGFWIFFIAIDVPILFQPWCDGARGEVFALVSLAFVGSHILWTRSALSRLERRYPVPPPLRLVMLRVFNSPALGDLIDSIKPWLSFGVIEHLHGPETSGSEVTDVVNLLRGRIGDSVAEDDAELDQEFARLRQTPDRNVQFARDPIQCTLASWKPAVSRMLARADAVVMDLSNLSRENTGCAYELGRLADEVPLSRVTLLVNDATDMGCLEELLNDVSKRMAATSPNQAADALAWRIVHTGGLSERGEHESAHDWKRRAGRRLDSLMLTGLLRDSALPRRSRVGAGDADAVPQTAVRWAREPLGRGVQKAVNVALILLLAASIGIGYLGRTDVGRQILDTNCGPESAVTAARVIPARDRRYRADRLDPALRFPPYGASDDRAAPSAKDRRAVLPELASVDRASVRS